MFRTFSAALEQVFKTSVGGDSFTLFLPFKTADFLENL